jgi:phenylalanyl-tRNA synthetase alpha chain
VDTYDYTVGAEPPSYYLTGRADAKAARMRWMLDLPDLSRQAASPVYYLVQQVLRATCVARADRVVFPDVISASRNFDLLNAPRDHPSRSHSDTYYLDDAHVLRTQTTPMWTWYLADQRVRERLSNNGEVTAVSHGKVYRNDEITRSHFPVFHQIDAICVADRAHETFEQRDLDELLLQIAHTVYGKDIATRVLDDSFPFTHSSRQLEIEWNDEWLEVVGAGLVHPTVLARLGLDPERYNGWAFGFGLDRLAMRKMAIPDIRILWSTDERITRQFTSIDSAFAMVSKYPATQRDISFLLERDRSPNDFYEIVRECGILHGEGIVEQVEPLDRYEDVAKFGADRASHTFRITYRSFERTLTHDEVNRVQDNIRATVSGELGAELR